MLMQIRNTEKNVAIITYFHKTLSYGGTLQAYALRKIISDSGYHAEQLSYLRDTGSSASKVKKMIRNAINIAGDTTSQPLLLQFNHTISTCVGYLAYSTSTKRNHTRILSFEKFNAKYIPHSQEFTKDTVTVAADQYDIFITGSDQVWNPIWFYPAHYLDFVPDNKPKIAYAASTAVSSLTEEQYAKMQPLIARINHISVREKNAVDLLKEMTPQKIEWVLDPTLLLTADEWNTIAADHPIQEPFIVVYLLGDNKANRRCAAEFAKEKGLPMVTFPFVGTQRLWQLHYGDLHCYGGPDTFVSLIRDAEYVITDSFHAVVFSILFKKRFVVLKRNADSETGAMNERLYSLFQITGMERQLVSANLSELKERIETISYADVEERLVIQREKSLAWLNDALDDASAKVDAERTKV